MYGHFCWTIPADVVKLAFSWWTTIAGSKFLWHRSSRRGGIGYSSSWILATGCLLEEVDVLRRILYFQNGRREDKCRCPGSGSEQVSLHDSSRVWAEQSMTADSSMSDIQLLLSPPNIQLRLFQNLLSMRFSRSVLSVDFQRVCQLLLSQILDSADSLLQHVILFDLHKMCKISSGSARSSSLFPTPQRT